MTTERTVMNQARLDWVMSGLNQYILTQAEDHFLKAVLVEFGRNQALTEQQEDRLEGLYRLKSQSVPNKKFDRFYVKKSDPKKSKPQRSRTKLF